MEKGITFKITTTAAETLSMAVVRCAKVLELNFQEDENGFIFHPILQDKFQNEKYSVKHKTKY